MKILKTVFISIFFIACSSVKETNTPTSLKPIYIENATNFAKSQFESCKTKNYIPISKSVAVPWLVRNLTITDMKNTCSIINEKYGELLDLKIEQTLLYKDRYVYRFKAKYSKKEDFSEIRVYSNLKHKYNGIFFRPIWNDKYTKMNPEN
jgi:hypothetical protein